ncbi:hypothetical protein ACQPXB_36080 [Amycolatopsis sp. CA-161197]|uniref:hypothetical protein n=1 Tax=Amycolatopsis sp. CA-161197 TaxID=3239922 RepID=UPI003D905DAB
MSNETSTQDKDAPKPFGTFLLQHAKGRTHDELSQALQDVVLACRETGKAGSITLKLTVKALDDQAFEVVDAISIKAPQGARPKSIWFATDDGELTRDNPHQLALMQTEENAR